MHLMHGVTKYIYIYIRGINFKCQIEWKKVGKNIDRGIHYDNRFKDNFQDNLNILINN